MLDWGGELSRHQKFTIVYRAASQDLRAFVGGMDFVPIVAAADEFHSTPSGWWHDVGVELRGGAAHAVMEEFRTRWEEAITLPPARFMLDGQTAEYNKDLEPTPTALPPPPMVLTPPPLPMLLGGTDAYTNTSVRILRSYGPDKGLFEYSHFAWNTLPASGVQEVFESLQRAIGQAQSYIYVEDQSINPVNPIEIMYQKHKKLFPLIADACRRGVKVVFVTQGRAAPGVPVAPAFTMSPEVNERILSGLSGAERENFAFFAVYQTKVHSKVVLVDDEFASIGSANFFDRSMTGEEVELNAAIMHEGGENSLIADLRVRLWCGHLRVSNTPDVVSVLRNRATGFAIFKQSWGPPVTFNHPDSALIEITP
jgi:phosphatidylserine/phosphatidylglycerophosphate/cardiolipin synthase-like enzyme